MSLFIKEGKINRARLELNESRFLMNHPFTQGTERTKGYFLVVRIRTLVFLLLSLTLVAACTLGSSSSSPNMTSEISQYVIDPTPSLTSSPGVRPSQSTLTEEPSVKNKALTLAITPTKPADSPTPTIATYCEDNLALLQDFYRGYPIPEGAVCISTTTQPSFECPGDGEPCTLDIPPDNQDHNLSCEASASGMAAAYFIPQIPGDYDTWEEYFVDVIPRNCNPHLGFRGSIDGNPSISCEKGFGYGVYAEPVAAALNKAGISARVAYGLSYEDVMEAIKNNHPVMVWISRCLAKPICEGTSCLIYCEHVWLVTGVKGEPGEYVFRVNDPKFGRQYWVYTFPRWDEFTSVDGIGRMSVVIGE
jgi:uncharacterized protein YvpB